jgi:hypothetical protein
MPNTNNFLSYILCGATGVIFQELIGTHQTDYLYSNRSASCSSGTPVESGSEQVPFLLSGACNFFLLLIPRKWFETAAYFPTHSTLT